MNKLKVKAVFIIPFYDKDALQLIDAISSIEYYTSDPYKIICIDDCIDKNIAKCIKNKINPSTTIVFKAFSEADWPRNTYGALFCKKFQAMEFAIQNFDFDFFVNMDTDALVTGHGLFESTDNKLGNKINSSAGIIGSYKIRADGQKRTRWKWVLFTLYLAYIKRKLNRKTVFWKQWLPLAMENGYKLGAHILGGAFITSRIFFEKINSIYPYHFMVNNDIQKLPIGDDVIFSLLVFTAGFKIVDFGRPEDPLVIALDYLPVSKERVVSGKKQLIHSLKKGLNGESEEELRSYFKSMRK